jgi:hypothetical protein
LTAIAGLATAGANSMGGDGATVANTIMSGPWSCTGVSASSGGFLTFVARAKRINVYGDAVELVWFDEPVPTDFMYAIYAVLVGAQVQGFPGVPRPSALCSRPLPAVGRNILLPPGVIEPSFTNRDIVTVANVGDPPGDPPGDPKNAKPHGSSCHDAHGH